MRYDKEVIRSTTSIVEVASQYVKLRRSGQEWMGRCPFHNDLTPSFNVRDTTRTFKCYGCGASGDVFSFLMMMEGLSFSQALESLAGSESIPKQEAPILQRRLVVKPREEIREPIPQHIKNRRAYGSLAYLAGFVPRDFYYDFQERAAVMQFDVLKARGEHQFRSEAAGLAILQNPHFLDHSTMTREHIRLFQSTNPFIANVLPVVGFSGLLRMRVGIAGSSVIFWCMDRNSNFTNAKVMRFSDGFHRSGTIEMLYAKEPSSLFGEHLLAEYPSAIVNLVESEKSAVYAQDIGKMIWLATGGVNGLTEERAKVLKDRHVYINFDADEAGRAGAERAVEVIRKVGGKAFALDPFSERNDGWDLADEIHERINS